MQNGSERWLRVLGLSPGASEQAVKEAYRDLVKVWHPDRFGSDARLREKAQKKLTEVNEAYEQLRNYRPSDPSTQRPQPGPAASTYRPSTSASYGPGTSEPPRQPAARPTGMTAALLVTAAVGVTGLWLLLSGLRAADAPVSSSSPGSSPEAVEPAPSRPPQPPPPAQPTHSPAQQGRSPSPAAERSSASETATGSLLVNSQPSGGRVFLDGEFVGETSLLIGEVIPGDHQIKIDFAARGYEPWTSPVVIVAGQQEKLLAVMTKTPARKRN